MYFSFFAVNRRLDEWIDAERLDVNTKVKVGEAQPKEIVTILNDIADGTDRKITRNQKRKHDEINHVQKVSFNISMKFHLLK